MSEINTSRPCVPGEVMAMKIAKAEFLNAIAAERDRQDAKWGRNFVGVDRMLVILGEEIGEACKAQLEDRTAGKDELLAELIQCAAVCSKLYELVVAGSR